MVFLIADALLQNRGSGRRSFEEGSEDGTLTTSIAAAVGKLRRMPISLSVGLLTESTIRLMELFPQGRRYRCPPRWPHGTDRASPITPPGRDTWGEMVRRNR